MIQLLVNPHLGGKPGPISQFAIYSLGLTLLGAWLGTFTIPLDWKQDWQAFPTPCLIGAVTGHLVSHLACLSIGLVSQ